MRILIVDDDSSVRTTLVEVFKENYVLTEADSAEKALELIEKMHFDLVLTDNKMSGKSGIELIKIAKQNNPETSFILLTAYAAVEQAVEAIKLGADDYMLKPFDIDEIEHRVKQALNLRRAQKRLVLDSSKNIGTERIIGNSKNIQEARGFIDKISDVDSSVLILGPSGAGKEVMAQTIHETSLRKGKPFVAINCATLNEQLIESELFGHEKGAFTGALAQKLGKFELASEGTIFLDEIGEMPLDLQSKLLRVLQEKEFSRVGGNKTIQTSARIIAATNRDLKKMIQEGTFREDLFFRLNVLTFSLLALVERKEDIVDLCSFFWDKISKEVMRSSLLDEGCIEVLKSYHFPGNIRELKNILERMMVLGPKEGTVTKEYLPQDILGKPSPEFKSNYNISNGLTAIMDEMEKSIIQETMELADNNQVKASELLKIKRGTLQYKLKKYGI